MASHKGARSLTQTDLDCISLGAGILGSGGGGSTFAQHLITSHLLSLGCSIDVIPLEALKDDDLVISIAFMGAPTVNIEKIPRGNEAVAAVRALERALGRKAAALMPAEIGGANALVPILAATIDPKNPIPILDADGMGRAFPELQMFGAFVHGVHAAPAALADEKGNSVIISDIASSKSLENILRAVVVTMGCSAALAISALTGTQLKNKEKPLVVNRSMSLAWQLGKRIASARASRQDPVLSLTQPSEVCSALQLLTKSGKVVDVSRSTEAGFVRGRVLISIDKDAVIEIEFQNEFLIACMATADQVRIPRARGAPVRGRVLAVVPDLVVIVDADTAEPIASEDMRYGLGVAVLAMPCDPLMSAPVALPVVGPAAFGFTQNVSWPSLASTWKATKCVGGFFFFEIFTP